MRRWIYLAAFVALACLPGLANVTAAERDKKAAPEGATCGSFGTAVDFVDTPSAAAKKAKEEKKLVFVLHVSGHFEDPRFT